MTRLGLNGHAINTCYMRSLPTKYAFHFTSVASRRYARGASRSEVSTYTSHQHISESLSRFCSHSELNNVEESGTKSKFHEKRPQDIIEKQKRARLRSVARTDIKCVRLKGKNKSRSYIITSHDPRPTTVSYSLPTKDQKRPMLQISHTF